jgi:hypothetical protein
MHVCARTLDVRMIAADDCGTSAQVRGTPLLRDGIEQLHELNGFIAHAQLAQVLEMALARDRIVQMYI